MKKVVNCEYPKVKTTAKAVSYPKREMRKTRKTETSKYPKEKKSTEIPWVVASENGKKSKNLTKEDRIYWKIKPKKVIAL